MRHVGLMSTLLAVAICPYVRTARADRPNAAPAPISQSNSSVDLSASEVNAGEGAGDGAGDDDDASDDVVENDATDDADADVVTGESESARLAMRLADLEAQLANLQTSTAARRSPIRFSGHADLGFFLPLGNGGVGVQRDVANEVFPEYASKGWLFYGDLLATQVNSRGEVADLGDLAGVNRFDSVNSNGNPSFLVNEVNQTITAGLSPSVIFTASANLVPRQGREFSLGDWLDVDLAQLEWLPGKSGDHSVFVGKFDSLLGHEYRTRKANQKFGITPTLLARYTTGTAIGIKARSKLLNNHLVLAAAVTNGSFGTEQFHFYDEIDSNRGKTLSGRVALRHELYGITLEVAGSGEYGTQDGAVRGKAYLYGVDAHISTIRMGLHFQWLRGSAPGDELSKAYRLALHNAAYVEGTALVTHRIGLLLRGEMRDAETELAPERVYLTKSWRAVVGARWVINPHIVYKIEYLHNGEFGRVPKFDNDIATTSLVISY